MAGPPVPARYFFMADAMQEAAEILDRSRQAGETVKAEIMVEAKGQAERTLAKAHEQIERDTLVAVQQIKTQAAELTLLAAEKVATRSLTGADHRRLIEEALSEIDAQAALGKERA